MGIRIDWGLRASLARWSLYSPSFYYKEYRYSVYVHFWNKVAVCFKTYSPTSQCTVDTYSCPYNFVVNLTPWELCDNAHRLAFVVMNFKRNGSVLKLRVINVPHFKYWVGCGIWLYQFLIIAYLFTLYHFKINVHVHGYISKWRTNMILISQQMRKTTLIFITAPS